MNAFTSIAAAIAFLLGSAIANAAPEAALSCYELRTYHAAEGKLDALNARFREHTVALFTRHGMTSIGYWMPVKNPGRELIYLLGYPDRTAREDSWKAFHADAEWIAAKAESEKGGQLVDKVDSLFLKSTDFSARLEIAAREPTRIFELRTYSATPGNLPRLLDRFRQHTVALFAKHGMTNVAYFTMMDGQPASENTLVYLLAHASLEARDKSFGDFSADPEWQKASADSETAAGGPLTIPNGVASRMLSPTDYSPLR